MAVNTQANDRVNQGIILFIGIIILLGAFLTYLFILRGVFGNYSSAELLPDFKSLKTAFSGDQQKAAILYSRYTENMLPENSTWVRDNLNTWKKFLSNNNIKFDVINDADIETGKLNNYRLLILPGSKSLSDKEIIQAKKYLDAGGNIYATGGIASYSVDGKWRGWEFFSEVFGLKFSKEIKSSQDSTKNNSSDSHVHTLRGNLPLTAGIPAGFLLKIAEWDRPMAAEVLDPRTTQVSFWYTYSFKGLVREEIKNSTGIAYGFYGKGRFVWMGFEINSIIGVQEDYVIFDKLFKNCIKWLTNEPTAFIKDWPSNYSAAAVVAPVLTHEVNNIKNLFVILKNEGINATFFIDKEKADQNKSLLRILSGFGEIGAITDLGYLKSESDTVNKLFDYYTQYENLKDAKTKIESVTKKTVYGTLPYYGFFDNNSMKVMSEINYKYLISDSLVDRSVPKTITRGNDKVVVIGVSNRDDYSVIRDYGLSQNEFQFYTYQEDIDKTLFEGGLYFFRIHTDYQCKQENVEVVNEIIKDLKKKNFWIATANEIQDWYSKRDLIELRTERRGKRRVSVTISNPGSLTADNLSVIVDLNDRADKIELNTENIGTKKAEFYHEKGSKNIHIFIDNLLPDESRTYFIDYDIINV